MAFIKEGTQIFHCLNVVSLSACQVHMLTRTTITGCSTLKRYLMNTICCF